MLPITHLSHYYTIHPKLKEHTNLFDNCFYFIDLDNGVIDLDNKHMFSYLQLGNISNISIHREGKGNTAIIHNVFVMMDSKLFIRADSALIHAPSPFDIKTAYSSVFWNKCIQIDIWRDGNICKDTYPRVVREYFMSSVAPMIQK